MTFPMSKKTITHRNVKTLKDHRKTLAASSRTSVSSKAEDAEGTADTAATGTTTSAP